MTFRMLKPSGAASSVMAGGSLGLNHVSVSVSISSLLSVIKSWMRAALLRADLAFRQPKLISFNVFTGPGFISTSPDNSSKSETKTVAGRRAVRGRNGTVPAGRHHSSTDAGEKRLGPRPAKPDGLRLPMGNTLQQQRVIIEEVPEKLPNEQLPQQ